MPTSLVEGQSLIAIDVGATTTRAALFDVVEGVYRFIAVGMAPSTAEAPFKNVGLGVREAILGLQTVTGRTFLDEEQLLIVPSQPDGTGIDSLSATISAGPPVTVAIIGLLSDVSMESARQLAESSYCRIVERVDLNDHRKPDEQIDSLLRARPDVILLTGGTDGGATRSIKKMLETVGLACYLSPSEKRPLLLFAGNASLTDDVKILLGTLTPSLHISPNVRPSLETVDLDPAVRDLATMVSTKRKTQLTGVDELETLAHGHLLPTSYASGRMIRFLGQMTGSEGGVLGLDIGPSAAMVAASFQGGLTLRTYPQFGLGENFASLLQYTDIDEIMNWLSIDVHKDEVREYLYQRTLYPSALPATLEEQAISQAITRQCVRLAMRAARRDFPATLPSIRPDLTPLFEMIIASGGALADAPTPGQGLLVLLDSVQPVGITNFLLDHSNLLPMLGGIAEQNSLLPVQVLESGVLQDLGTVVSVVSNESYGTPVLRVRMLTADKNETKMEIKLGGLEVLPLSIGQAAKLNLQPLHRADIGLGPGRGQTITVRGGTLGVVIDARSRPLRLNSDPVRRRELIKKWHWVLGG